MYDIDYALSGRIAKSMDNSSRRTIRMTSGKDLPVFSGERKVGGLLEADIVLLTEINK